MARRPAGRWALAVALTVALGAASACTPPGQADAAPGGAPSPTVVPATPAPAGTTPRADLLPDIPVRRATPPPAVDRPAPERLTIGTGDEAIVMPVDPVGVADDGSMELPPDADRAGWYRYGRTPGDPAGHTVLAAHVDSRLTGIGPLADLDEVEPGTVVTVRTADGTQHRYRTTDVVRLAKDDAPVSAWFAREGPARLVVITCGGAWDAAIGHYADNVVLTAEPVAP